MTFAETVAAAVADLAEHGYDSAFRVEKWMDALKKAAEAEFIPPGRLQEQLNRQVQASYQKLVLDGQLLKYHPGVGRFTLDRLQPQLRLELDRMLLASQRLIRLNREAAVLDTQKRFLGWASSIPAGGSRVVDRREEQTVIKKRLRQLPFEDRRVIIDQGHKFVAALNRVLAEHNNAIAAEWHSHWRRPGYDYREDHKERDELVFAIRGNWALADGLMTVGAGYLDEMTQPAEEVSCTCYLRYLYSLRALPAEMVTAKGRGALANIRLVA